MNVLKKQYYLTEVLRMHRGNSHGTPVNAKPLYVLALIECINERILKENVIAYPNREIENVYYDICRSYEPFRTPSPYILPYFHLIGESYYDIKWKGKKFVPHPKAHSPSAKYLKENVEYAFLESEFWNLLQSYNIREDFRLQVINFFLKPKK